MLSIYELDEDEKAVVTAAMIRDEAAGIAPAVAEVWARSVLKNQDAVWAAVALQALDNPASIGTRIQVAEALLRHAADVRRDHGPRLAWALAACRSLGIQADVAFLADRSAMSRGGEVATRSTALVVHGKVLVPRLVGAVAPAPAASDAKRIGENRLQAIEHFAANNDAVSALTATELAAEIRALWQERADNACALLGARDSDACLALVKKLVGAADDEPIAAAVSRVVAERDAAMRVVEAARAVDWSDDDPSWRPLVEALAQARDARLHVIRDVREAPPLAGLAWYDSVLGFRAEAARLSRPFEQPVRPETLLQGTGSGPFEGKASAEDPDPVAVDKLTAAASDPAAWVAFCASLPPLPGQPPVDPREAVRDAWAMRFPGTEPTDEDVRRVMAASRDATIDPRQALAPWLAPWDTSTPERAESVRSAAQVARLATDLAREREASLRGCVLAFHDKMGQDAPAVPAVPDERTVRFRARFMVEELFETLGAMFAHGRFKGTSLTIARSALDEMIDQAPVFVDLPTFADGCVDLLYVTEGSLIAFGIDSRAVLAEVQRANMLKEGGNKRADGKILKGPGWTPPDVAGVLRKLGWAG